LRARARALRLLPRRRRSGFYVDGRLRSYPEGYTIAGLGPPDDWTAPGQARRAAAPARDEPHDERFCHHQPRQAGSPGA
jgi:hypothetical protein